MRRSAEPAALWKETIGGNRNSILNNKVGALLRGVEKPKTGDVIVFSEEGTTQEKQSKSISQQRES